MAEIEEIPINAESGQETTTNIPENNGEIQENHKEIQENTQAKKRGRPAGSLNKAKPKPAPKPKPKPKAKTKETEYEDYSEEDEESVPVAPPRRRATRQAEPQELDRHALAGEVLSILQQQRYNQTSARRNHYNSWFANM